MSSIADRYLSYYIKQAGGELGEAGENLKQKAEEKLKTISSVGVRMTKCPRLNKIKSSANKMRRHLVRKRRRDRIVQRDIFST
ncbi:hypothetical protein J437_LFUL018978 [Ladona fulva]|uniref:Uncharacterized protein n=1 Tax=Ladona fulva TaxID=123851 RepID=A0A8K0KRH1_LADFU|nr:hypothetical protein J437_LFUL018978 [Ladona fulva]